jgi:Fe-S-cluster-containing hydrogenase component 2
MKFVLDAELCTGCRACELACSFEKEGVFSPAKSRIHVVKIDEEGVDVPVGCEPCSFGAIQYDDVNGRYFKCDLCSGEPECIKWCFTGAISLKEMKNITRERHHSKAKGHVHHSGVSSSSIEGRVERK